MRFVDVKNDVAFRKIFGNENRKEVLISFLNAVLMLENEQKIVSVDVLMPFQLPLLSPGNATIVDVKAKDQRNKSFLVEIQVGDVNGLTNQVLYYASKNYSSPIERDGLDKKLSPIFFIGILCFEANQNKEYLGRLRVTDVGTDENLIEDIEFTFIELPKFNKKPTELTSTIDRWVYFIKNAGDIKVIPEDTTDEGLKSAYDGAEQYNWSKAELEAYDKVSMREQDDRGKITCARQEGEELGVKKGREQMAEEFRQEKEDLLKEARQKEEENAKELRRKEEENAAKIISIAKNLLKQGFSIEDTAKATGLPVEEVRKWKDKK